MIDTLPPDFLMRMKQMLGDEYPAFLNIYRQFPTIGIRVNRLKITPDELLSLLPYDLKPIPWTEDGFLVSGDLRPGKNPYYAAGLYYVQDPSAMAVSVLMNPQPGERILDLSAAPGGKSTHIASIMRNRGILVANDTNPARVKSLAKNIERWGAKNVVITNETPKRLSEKFGVFFDKVLVDAPCSGEGTFRKDSVARRKWSPEFVERCSLRQDGILHHAAKLVRLGGVLVYATCTFAPQENEGSVLRFLDNHPNFRLLEAPQFDGFDSGKPEWINKSKGSDVVKDCVRLWPHRLPGEGHFIALMKKVELQEIEPVLVSEEHDEKYPTEERTLFESFVSEACLSSAFSEMKMSLKGTYLYGIPEGLPDIRGLRVVHWGWWLGTMRKKRFVPSHALAMGLDPKDVKSVIPLSLSNPDTLRFLRGEVLPSKGRDGWTLVTLDGYPLGWGKRVNGRLKSHTPKWLRWI